VPFLRGYWLSLPVHVALSDGAISKPFDHQLFSCVRENHVLGHGGGVWADRFSLALLFFLSYSYTRS
jgi:hypothetical protein